MDDKNKELQKQAERKVAQQLLGSMVRSVKGRAAIIESCRTYILNKAGELHPTFMPTLDQLHKLEGEMDVLIDRVVRGEVTLDMISLNSYCDKIANVIAFGTQPPTLH